MLYFVTSFLRQCFENCKDGKCHGTPGGRYEFVNSVFSGRCHCIHFHGASFASS